MVVRVSKRKCMKTGRDSKHNFQALAVAGPLLFQIYIAIGAETNHVRFKNIPSLWRTGPARFPKQLLSYTTC